MMRSLLLFALLILGANFHLDAAPTQTTPFIRIDQFGYLPNSKKVAVIADPQVGFNAAEAYSPGTGANQYQVRRWHDDVVVFTGTLQAWNNGVTHTQSGDKGWWFDFSAVTTEGSYYIFDLATQKGSYRFEIGNNVYNEVLRQAMRTFYYQRINYAKVTPFADTRWTENAFFDGPGQDRFATSRFAKGNMTTARDLHGGWMDAGDLNKYTTFAESAVIQLMEAYRLNPAAFADNYNIPESGNGIPDILDEVKFELDWLKRMQDATGTNGFFLKLGNDNYNFYSPPSTDPRPRYYLPECTSATLAGCAMFAVSGVTMKLHPAMISYGQDLLDRAEAAWERAKITTNNFTSWQTACDDGDIKSGDADRDAAGQLESAFVAAVYLYEATGKAEYKTFAEARYTQVRPYSIWWWGPYWGPQQIALLRLADLPGISTTVRNNIRNQKAGMNYLYSIDQYNAGTDLYRAHMGDDTYHWGHNQARANAGHYNLDFINFNINTSNHSAYREVAEQYMHWFHGVNPLGKVMLSNMYDYGAESCMNEIYHTWFHNGTVWDNAISSPKGPAPGYVPGGPNKQYSGSLSWIASQPHQKAYHDWNTEWPESSWEITENAIYYQAAYVMLLARLMPAVSNPPTDTEPPSIPLNLAASAITTTGLTLSWNASSDNVAVVAYEVFMNGNLLNANVSGTTYNVTGLTCNTGYTFYVRARDAAGNQSGNSNTVQPVTAACPPAPVSLTIYDDVIGTDWTDWSWGAARNFTTTTPRKVGNYSVRVDYQANGGLSFRKGTAVQTTPTTQLKFWVYADNNTSFAVTTRTGDETGVSTQVNLNVQKRKWVEQTVNLSQLGNPSSIKRVDLKSISNSAFTLYFDNIRLLNVIEASGSQPEEGGGGGSGSGPGKGKKAGIAGEKTALGPIISLSPNPASGKVQMVFTSFQNKAAALKICDASGRIGIAQTIQVVVGKNSHVVDISHLSPGVYWVMLEGYKARKLMVVR